MTLVWNKRTGVAEADVRDRVIPRLHVSLGTTRKAEAAMLHAAVVALVREGDADLVNLLRHRKVNVQAVARCVRERRPFSDLRPKETWPTVAAAAEAYVAWLRDHPEREAGTASVAHQQLQHFTRAFGEAPLDRVPLADAAAWQGQLLATVSANYGRTIVGRVVALYAWHAAEEARAAAAEGRRARPLAAPLDPKTRPTRVTKRERYLTREEAARLWLACPAALRALVGCGLLAGLRIREVLWLRPGVDVDLARDMLLVQARGERDDADYWRPKSGERREVPLGRDLRALLVHHLEHYASAAYVFPADSAPDRPLHPNRARERFARVVTAAGLDYGREDPQGVVFHTLRHTFASWLMQADVNPVRISKLLGNSLEIVMSTYGHLAPTDNRAAVALLNDALPRPSDDPTDDPTDDPPASSGEEHAR